MKKISVILNLIRYSRFNRSNELTTGRIRTHGIGRKPQKLTCVGVSIMRDNQREERGGDNDRRVRASLMASDEAGEARSNRRMYL